MLTLLCIICLASQVSGDCKNPDSGFSKTFPNVISSLPGSSFYLTAEVNVQTKDTKETAFFEEIVDYILQIGTVNYLQGDYEQVVYYDLETREMFGINSSGIGCTTSKLENTKKNIFPNTNLKQWYYNDEKNVYLGPFSVIQNAFKSKKANYIGPTEAIRGIPAECWGNCVEDLLFTYCFSDANLKNPYGFSSSSIPLRVTVTNPDDKDYKLTYEYFDFNPIGKEDYIQFPRELGCQRLKEDDDSDQLPNFGKSDLRLHAEIVYDDLGDNFPKYITNVELVYKNKMKIAAFSFTEWITEGKESQHETPEKTVFNIKTGSSYTIDKMTGECQFRKNEFAPRLRMPDKSHLAFDNPELFVEGLGFYKADTINDDRGYRTIVYEKQAEDFFMGSDFRYPKASITRYYLEDDTHSVREPGTDNIPSKIVLKLKSPDGMDQRIITINIFTFTTKVDDYKIFDIDDCFTDQEEYTWIQFRFKMPQDKRDEIIKRSVLAPEILKNKLYDLTEATPLRFSKFLVDYDCNGMTISGKLHERIPLHGYTPVYKKRVKVMDGTRQIGKGFCAYFCDWNKQCSGFSDCASTCILTEQKPVEIEDNQECTTYIRDAQRTPNSTELVKSFGNIFLGPKAQKLILSPPEGSKDPIELQAISIESSQNNIIGKRIPNIFSLANDTSYEVAVEVNYLESERLETIYFEEKYDIIQGEGKIIRRQEGNVTTYFYFQETNELFTITSDDKCSVEFLNDSNPFGSDFLQNWDDFEKDNTLIGPSSVLRKAYLKDRVQNLLFVSSGDANIRGVSNVFWMHCPTDSDDTTVKYYFSKEGNQNPYGDANGMYPLRVRTFGKISDSEDLPTVNQTYEFLSFKPLINPESIAIPYGLGCPRLASEDDLIILPPFPENTDYILSGEMVFNRNLDYKSPKLFSYFQVIYDHRSETIALKYSNWKESRADGEISNPTPYKLIVLRRSGVSYFIDLDSDNCTTVIDKLISRNFDMPDGTELDVIGLVLNTQGYTYLDRYQERDLPVLGFEKVVKNFSMVAKTFDKAIITRFTLDDDTFFIQQQRYADNAPMRVTAKLFNKDVLDRTISLNIFSFRTIVTRKYKHFNIDECYLQGRDSTWFQVMYPVDDSDVLKRAMQNVQRIKDQFISDIIYRSQISPHRFADILVETDDTSIFVITKLLERPNPLVDFTKRENQSLLLVNQEYALITAQECAVQCLEAIEGCGGFSYCGATCQLANPQADGKAPPTRKDNDCSFYEFTAQMPAPTSNQVLKTLKERVERGELVLVFPPNKDYSKEAQITPSVLTVGASSRFGNIFRGNSEFFPTQVRTKYKLSYSGNRLLTLPLAQCLTVCSQDSACTSVSVCMAGSEKCIVSTLDPYNIPNDTIIAASSCAILGKSYVSRFSKFPGVAHIREPEKSIPVKNLEECAKKCFTDSKIQCLSFDLCDGGSTCYLHTKHGLDISSNTTKGLVEKTCAHYSKRYMFDFKLSSKGQQIASGGDVKMYDASLEQCARACADGQKGIYCMSFDFCAQSGSVEGTCLLSTQGSGGKLITKPICNHYIRTKDLNVSSTKPYSYSLAGGLAFLFILIGAVLGAAAIYGYGYFKANRQI